MYVLTTFKFVLIVEKFFRLIIASIFFTNNFQN
jgi:hypothetical protein